MTKVLAKLFKKNRIKYSEILFQSANLLSMVLSTGVVTGGVYLLFTFDRYSPIFERFVIRNVGQLIALLGCFGIAFSFVGCIFFHYKKKGLVCLYVVSVTIIYCGEVGAGLVLVEKKGEIENSTRVVLEIAIHRQYGLRVYEKETDSIDLIQRRLNCCGIDGWQDWITNFLFRKTTKWAFLNTTASRRARNKVSQVKSIMLHLLSERKWSTFFTNHIRDVLSKNMSSKELQQAIPSSCCRHNGVACQQRIQLDIYKEGCNTHLTNEFSSLSEFTGIIVALIGFVQVIGTVVGACIVKCIRAAEASRSSPI